MSLTWQERQHNVWVGLHSAPHTNGSEDLRAAAAYVGRRSPTLRDWLLMLADDLAEDRIPNVKPIDYNAIVPAGREDKRRR